MPPETRPEADIVRSLGMAHLTSGGLFFLYLRLRTVVLIQHE